MHVNHPKCDHLTKYYNWGGYEVVDANNVSILKVYDVAECVFTDLWFLKDKKPFCLLIQVGGFPVCETTMYSERLEKSMKMEFVKRWTNTASNYKLAR